MQKVFVIADNHFGHENIIKYEKRPFANKEEMDKIMVERWNEVVDENDLVFHLGDVILSEFVYAKEILPKLNGRKILVQGNHDKYSKKKWNDLGFMVVQRYFYEGYLLTHKPESEEALRVAVKTGMLKGNIHGHVHSKVEHLDKELYKCCCVELIDYRPIEFNEFVKI